MKSNTLSLILPLVVAVSLTSALNSQVVEPVAPQPTTEGDKSSASIVAEVEESDPGIVQAAYDVAYEKMIQDSAEDLTIENRILIEQLKEFPLFPEEETIAGFPDPIDATEVNPEILSEAYTTIGEAYLNEAEKLSQRYGQTNAQLARVKQTMGVETFRTQDQKLETTRTLTRNKDFLFGYKTPSKSEKYIRSSINQRSRENYARHSLQLKQDIEILALKGTFYSTMALALLPNELIGQQD
ncbi:MAG: hypothetical protein ABFQ95_05585 [Pseudomonadota bacterium]